MEGVGGDVVVGDHEAVGGDEGSGAAAVEADGGKADVIEPSIGEIEVIFGFDLRTGRRGEKPHTFVGAQGAARDTSGEDKEEGTEFHRGKAKAGGARGGEQEGGGAGDGAKMLNEAQKKPRIDAALMVERR